MTKGLRKCRAVGCEENRKQVSLAAHEPLEIAPRFPHSRSPGSRPHGKVEIQRQDSHFPTLILPLSNQKQRKEINPGLIASLQAHLSIRKCLGVFGVCLTVLGVALWDHVVSLRRIQIAADS